MSDEQILKKAFAKAIKNGWKPGGGSNITYDDFYKVPIETWYIPSIFSHSFAKAFWKDHKIIFTWKYHLQQMVLLSDNEKIKYLKKFL